MERDLTAWLRVVDIPDFGIMGGEPLINPEIREWLCGVRRLMPKSQIRFTTNGVLLDRHFDVLDVAHEIGNTVFKITVHTPGAGIESVIKRVFDTYNWEPVTEHGIQRWRTTNNLRFQINRPTQFVKSYKGVYNNMMPYNSVPAESFGACIQQTCPLLYKGKIYKCSTQGLLKETLEKLGNPNINEWETYLVDGISVDNKSAINQFVANFGRPHKVCQMCPSKRDAGAFIIHKAELK
jgi:sulfatase maturation enzyme AslB (radical SAM superfamily)